MINVNLTPYKRRDFSNILQIAQQCADAGQPLPCWFVEMIVDKHDAMLPQGPSAAPVKKNTATPRGTTKSTATQRCVLCGQDKQFAKKLECGAVVCSACYNKVL